MCYDGGMSRLAFENQGTVVGSRARAGAFTTRHGRIETPVFMPVGTQATVKGLAVETLTNCGSRMLLANTGKVAYGIDPKSR